MRLSSGDRLGDYVIAGVLGEGGMGVVYRAHDLRLKRDVAIKTLRDDLPERDEANRVVQEARRAARLNHPNICTIHEVHEAGAFIVMELVDGRTLASMIPSGGLPSEAVASYGAQIADALAHAHERGIVHRDIKSANVLVTPSGRLKVLDFGLARPTPAAAGEATTEAVSDVTPTGTLAYMAPEVLCGKVADERSDIWALGVVLYEMAAGRRPFGGATVLQTASAILHEPLPPLPTAVPGGIRAVIQRCLQRQPDERYGRATDVRSALEVLRDPFLGSHGDTPPVVRGRGGSRHFSRRWALGAIAAVAAVAAGAWLYTNRTSTPGASRLSGQRAVALFGGSYRQASLSPDGALVAFVDARAAVPQIWVKNLAGGDPIQITKGDVAASNPAWSPGNDQIVFARRQQGLWTVSPLGGPARQLLDFGERPRFAANGERLVFERNRREIWTARSDGSDAQRVKGVPEPWYSAGMSPALSPDGQSIVYFAAELGPNGDLWIVPASGGEPRRVTSDLTEASDPIWMPDGRSIVFSSLRGGSRTLWQTRVDGGQPEPLTIGAGDDIEPALSSDGRTILYTNVRNEWRLLVTELASWEPRAIVERRTELLWPRFSPDGASIAFFGRGQAGDVQLFVVSAEGREVRQLTTGRGQINTMPRWAPDGSRIFFYQNRPTNTFRSMPSAGGASIEVAKWPWETHTNAEVGPGGARIVYQHGPGPGQPGVKHATVIFTIANGDELRLPEPLSLPRWSPDGSAVVGSSRARPPVVTTCPADGGPCQSLAPGYAPVWARDGSRIYFLRDGSGALMKELWSMTADGQDLRKLNDAVGPMRPIDVTFDVSGSQLTFSQIQQGRPELWQAELR